MKSKILLSLTMIGAILIACSSAIAVTVRTDHPRLHITSETLPILRERARTTNYSEYKYLLDLANSRFNSASAIYENVVTYALLYQLGEITGFSYTHTPEEYGNKAVQLVDEFADAVLAVPNANEIRSATGDYTHCLSIGYDWLNDLLTDEVKTKLFNAIIHVRDNTAPQEWGDNYSATARQVIIAGLAFYGDHINDAKAKEYVDLFKPLWIEGVLPSMELISNGDGGHDEGYEYSRLYMIYGSRVLDAWRTATGENLFANASWYLYYPYWLIYICQTRPIKTSWESAWWRGLKISDTPYNRFHNRLFFPLMLVASIHNDLGNNDEASLTTWFIQNKVYDYSGYRPWYAAWQLIWYDKSIPAKSPSEVNLSLTRYFSGAGEVIMRTGFGDADDTLVAFIDAPYWVHPHTHCHQNSFIIERKGGLALDSGRYEDMDTTHDWNYNERTIAHNSITIYELGETFYRPTNDGGQRYISGYIAREIEDIVPGSKWQLGGIARFETVPDEYDYMMGDATRAYQSTLYKDYGNIAKISNFTRQFVYLRPELAGDNDIFVVYDRVTSTNANFAKKWLLHMPFEPNINGNASADPIYPWHAVYDGDLVEFYSTTNESKLFSKTLLPEAHRIVKIGGPGHEFEGANGTNWPIQSGATYENWMGAWRVEVKPTVARTDDIFFHVLEVTDSGATNMTPTVRIGAANDNMLGVQIVGQVIDKLVMFSKTEANQTEVTYSITSLQEVKHLIADFEPLFAYNIYQNGAPIDTKSVSDAGTIYFTSTGGGTFQITQGAPNLPPTVSITAEPTSGTVPLAASFTATAEDPDGTVESYAWDFGDGGTSNEQNPIRTYNTEGIYTVTVEVTDNGGAKASDTISISVTDIPVVGQPGKPIHID